MTTPLKSGKGYALLRPKDAVPEVIGRMEAAQPPATDTPSVVSVLVLYDIFGEDFLGGISARRVVSDLASLGDAPDLEVRLNSPGGDVFEGIAVYNALTRFPGNVTVHVDGLAASIASLVALAGNKTLVAENAMLMVHRPWTAMAGDAEELRRQAETLDKAWSAMLATYARRTGRRQATLAQRVADEGGEWWMTAEEAVAEGFADGTEKAEKQAQVFGLERFRKVPARLAARARPPAAETKEEGEEALPVLPRTAEIASPRIEREPPAEVPVAEAVPPPEETPAPAPAAPTHLPGPSVAARRRIVEVLRLTT